MLKTIFNCKIPGRAVRSGRLACLMLVLLAGTREARSEGNVAVPVAVQRVAQMVDYVAADYAGAVRDGQVLQASEYNEQRELLGEAGKLVPELGSSEADRATLAGQLAEVVQAVEAKASPEEVQRRCRTVRSTLKSSFHLRMVPTGDVDAARGASLYGTLCANCHGATGHADTPTAAALTPHPLSFHDGERMVKVAPSLAYHALTFGITGTGMAPFDQLPSMDRWHLAFYVVALRHGQPGAAAHPSAPAGVPAELLERLSSPAVLAELSDEELGAELTRGGVSAAAQPAALAYLRASAPFAASSGTSQFERARTLVGESLAAARRGDFAAAHRLAIAAYLDGVEPHEAALRIERPELLARIEAAFATLRQASDPGPSASVELISRQVQVIGALLSDAEQLHGGQASGAKAFLASLVIALREGIEVALLIAALLAFLRKSGQGALARSVHIGWLLSVPAGLLTFLLVGKLIDGAHRELAEGILTLVAAAILLSVTHWVLGAKEARHWLGFLRRRVEAVGGGGSSQGLWLAGIAFFAAYREALETALFYRALLLDVGPEGWRPVLLGVGVGIATLAVLVVIVGRIGRKLNPRPVMLASSALLALLALALTGHGIHALQEGGYLGMSLIMSGDQAWTGLPSFGIYPTWQGIGGQLLALALLLVPSVLGRIRPTRSNTSS